MSAVAPRGLGRALGRHATTIVLSIAAIGAAVTYWVVDRGAVSTNEAMLRKKNLFDAWRVDDIREVKFVSKGKAARLVRGALTDAGQRPWDVEIDGARYPADEQVVDQFLGALEFATADRRVADEAIDDKAMGFDAPRLTVDIDMGAQAYHLAIGAPAPAPAGAAYAKVKDHGASVVTPQLVAALEVAPDMFRSRSFVPYFAIDLAAIEIDGTGGLRRLVRAPWGGSRSPGFRFDPAGPEGGVRVASAALDKLLVALTDLQAEAFLDADQAKASKPEITISLTPRDPNKPRARLRIGGACPTKEGDVIAMRDAPTPAAVCVPKAPLDALATPAERLVDRKLVSAPADEISEVKLEGGGKTLEMARSGIEWHVRTPEDRTLNADEGKTFLGSLLEVEGDTFSTDTVPKPSASARVVSLLSGEEVDGGGHAERVEELSWGEATSGKILVRRAEDGAVLVIAADRMSAFAPSDLALRPRRVVDEVLVDLRAIRVEGGAHAERLTRRPDSTFELVTPKGEGLAADAGLASDLAQALSELTADRWIADKDDGSHGLEPPRFTVEADFGEADGGAPHTVQIAIGSSTAAGFFAQKIGSPAVFVAPRAFVDAADRWLVDRGSLTIDVDKVAGATLLGPGKKRVTLSPHGSKWVVDGAVPGTDAAALRDALTELVAEGCVSIGKAKPEQRLDSPSLEVRIDAPSGPPVKLVFGAGDTFHGTSVVYARRAGVDATFAVAQARVRPLLDAVGAP